MNRPLVLTALAALTLGALAGPALAMSDGAYDHDRQGCSGAADNADHPDRTEPGCHNVQLTVEDGGGHRYADVGTDQTPDGTNVHDGQVAADPGGQSCAATFDAGLTNGAPPGTPGGGCDESAQPAPDPAAGGGGAYFGADDNLDSGEHDSSRSSDNGPSDGGGIRAALDADTLATWLAALGSGDTAYLLTHPVPVLSAGTGACADGVCFSVQTERRTVFEGDGKGERDAYDYGGKRWDPYTCGGPTDGRDDCGGRSLGWWNRSDGTVHAEPGVQVYEDPDPQGSPIDPAYDGGATPSPTLYPIPGAYAGTCGVTAGGGPVVQAPGDTPVTNDAGQVAAPTGC